MTLQHVEAFCHMMYRSETSETQHVIWNSRDGVTPFMVTIDDEELTHDMRTSRDRLDPEHTPRVGKYVWADLTLERAIEFRREMVDRYWDDPDLTYPMNQAYDSKEDAVWKLAKGDMETPGGGGPTLVKVTADWLAGFVAGRRNGIPLPYPSGKVPDA